MQEELGRVSTAEMKNSYLLGVDHKDLLLRKELTPTMQEELGKVRTAEMKNSYLLGVLCGRHVIRKGICYVSN